MSKLHHYIGKLKPIKKLQNVTLEKQCKSILHSHGYSEQDHFPHYGSWYEMFCDKLREKYVIVDGEIYKIVSKNEDDYISKSYENPDGTINYEVLYPEDSCDLFEAIERALKSDKVDIDSMIEILHNAPISFGYGYDCDVRVKEPSYIITQEDMVKLFNYVRSLS